MAIPGQTTHGLLAPDSCTASYIFLLATLRRAACDVVGYCPRGRIYLRCVLFLQARNANLRLAVRAADLPDIQSIYSGLPRSRKRLQRGHGVFDVRDPDSSCAILLWACARIRPQVVRGRVGPYARLAAAGTLPGLAVTAFLSAPALQFPRQDFVYGATSLSETIKTVAEARLKDVYSVLSCYDHNCGVRDIPSYWLYVSSLNFYRQIFGRETLAEFGGGVRAASQPMTALRCRIPAANFPSPPNKRPGTEECGPG